MLETGDFFAGYRIIQMLGSGGMGEVYLAQHPRLPRNDALKILSVDISADPDFQRRFVQEADTAAKLWHPNVVAVHDRGESSGQLWIAMDYVDGTDSAQLLRRYPVGLPPDQVTAIVTAIADALDYVHGQGFLHRDVKPANILLAGDENSARRILLSDFGIARPMEEGTGLTATGLTMGTVTYAAPEQLMGQDIDGRADQYALAATAFHLLSGSAPYADTNPVAVISSHLTAIPPRLSELKPELAAADLVLARALAKDPVARYPTCAAFAAELAALLPRDVPALSDPTRAAPLAPAAAMTASPRSHSRKFSPAAVAGAVVVAVAAAAAAYVYSTRGEAAAPGHTAPSTPAASLDGTYKFTYDFAKRTLNGVPTPLTSDNTSNWAFRSSCDSAGCIATATALDKNNPGAMRSPAVTTAMSFGGGKWTDIEPVRHKVDQKLCIQPSGAVGAGSQISADQWELIPQPGGTLTGVYRSTVLSNDCGLAGLVEEVPLVASRISEVSETVIVADPVGVQRPSSPPMPTSPAGMPVLSGSYKFDLDMAAKTVDGAPAVGGATADETIHYAFRSQCEANRCVATGIQLATNNLSAPSGGPEVLEFMDGRWRNSPTLFPSNCLTGQGTQYSTYGWELSPRGDGTLEGTFTITALTDECGTQGTIYRTPVKAVPVGDTPPAAITADPALFLS